MFVTNKFDESLEVLSLSPQNFNLPAPQARPEADKPTQVGSILSNGNRTEHGNLGARTESSTAVATTGPLVERPARSARKPTFRARDEAGGNAGTGDQRTILTVSYDAPLRATARIGMVYRTPTGWRGSRGHQRGVEEGRQLGGELVGGVFGHVVSAVDGCAAQVGAPGCPDR